MRRTLLCLLIAGCACVASAQLTGIRTRAGYGWTGSINRTSGGTLHLNGLQLGADMPLSSLPMLTIGLTGEVLLASEGTLYRAMVSGRASVPGSQLSVFGGVGYATAQAKSGRFGSISGVVGQLGLSMPLGVSAPMLAPALEVAGYMASKSGLSGFSVSVAVKF